MTRFQVMVTRTYQMVVEVEAEDAQEAAELGRGQWDIGQADGDDDMFAEVYADAAIDEGCEHALYNDMDGYVIPDGRPETVSCDDCGTAVPANAIYTDIVGNVMCETCSKRGFGVRS